MRRDSTQRFGSRATAYAAFRPSYPTEAIDAALEGLGDPAALAVADVGAGTGISSRLFAERAGTVIAIEPNDNMRAQAVPHPRISWRNGTAQATGLPDASVDLVVACQAFHWFANREAMDEFRRIARRRATLLQYERDESDAFTRAYGDIVRSYATDDTEALRAAALETFASFPRAIVRRAAWPSAQALTRESLLGRASSSSYLPSSGEAGASLARELGELHDRFSRDGGVTLAMLTHVLTADWNE